MNSDTVTESAAIDNINENVFILKYNISCGTRPNGGEERLVVTVCPKPS